MSSIFTKIVNGGIPCYKIAEDEHHLAFLDVMPLVKGHTLVIPKKEVGLIFDLEAEAYKNLWAFAQQVAKNLKKAVPCTRVGISVIGLEVPHAHIHLLPMNSLQDMNFSRPRLSLSPAEYQEIQESIRSQS